MKKSGRNDDGLSKAIRSGITLPHHLGGESPDQYRNRITREVVSLVRKGNTPDRAFYAVTGRKSTVSLPGAPKGGRHRKASSKKKKYAAVASVVTIAALGVGAGGAAMLGGTVGADNALAVARSTFADVGDIKGDKNILVVGMDTRPEVNQGSGSAEDVPGHRTDTIAVVHVSDGGSTIDAVSIPRDTQITTEACSDGDSTPVKINSIYDSHGKDCLEDAVSDFTGVELDSYAEINFEAFTTLIDTMGGVDITTKTPIIDDTLGVIVPTSGVHHMNGAKLLDYARARKVEGTAKSDFDRIKRQQQVVNAVIKEIGEMSAVEKFDMVRKISTKISPHISVEDISTQDMLSLSKAMLSQDDGKLGTHTIPISGESAVGNLIVDEAGMNMLFDKIQEEV